MIFGLYKYLLPYQGTLIKLSDMDLHKSTDELYEFKTNLQNQIESDYKTIENLKKIENDFEDKFQGKLFTDPEEWRKEFFKYLESPLDQKVEQVEEIEEKKKVMFTILKRKLVRNKPEKKKIKKERYETPTRLLPRAKLGMYLFFPSVIILMLFIFNWMFFPELRLLHEYSFIVIGILLLFIGVGLVIHHRKIEN